MRDGDIVSVERESGSRRIGNTAFGLQLMKKRLLLPRGLFSIRLLKQQFQRLRQQSIRCDSPVQWDLLQTL